MTFSELEDRESVTVREIADTLKQYAEGGWAIIGHVVIKLLGRHSLTMRDRVELMGYAHKGRERQESLCRTAKSKLKNTAEYQEVFNYLHGWR